jgi:flavin reductase (DIM6/NTAB) family NADH-FMN oxidoreductase RutF
MSDEHYASLESLDLEHGIWDRVYTVAPLVLVGTREPDGSDDLAPKHMAFPLGWGQYFGFVCSASHGTYRNIERTGEFSVSYPRPADVVKASLTASPRCEDTKPLIGMLETFPAREIDCVFAANSHLHLECRHLDTFDGFGENSLIAGRVIAAHVARSALRSNDRDDADLLMEAPQLAYLYPGRFAVIDRTQAFPFPSGMRR